MFRSEGNPHHKGTEAGCGRHGEEEQQDPLSLSGVDVLLKGHLPLLQTQTRKIPVFSKCAGRDLRRG